MNKEEKNILKIIFAYEYYKNNITERYMRNLSENVVLDNDCLDIENLELIYVIPFKKYNQLKNENARLKEIENKLNFIKNRVKQGMSQENINKCAIELVNSYLKEILKEVNK